MLADDYNYVGYLTLSQQKKTKTLEKSVCVTLVRVRRGKMGTEIFLGRNSGPKLVCSYKLGMFFRCVYSG